MTTQDRNDPTNETKDPKTAAEAAQNGGQDSHAAGSGSSTGDPGKARGPLDSKPGVDPHGLGGAKK